MLTVLPSACALRAEMVDGGERVRYTYRETFRPSAEIPENEALEMVKNTVRLAREMVRAVGLSARVTRRGLSVTLAGTSPIGEFAGFIVGEWFGWSDVGRMPASQFLDPAAVEALHPDATVRDLFLASALLKISSARQSRVPSLPARLRRARSRRSS